MREWALSVEESGALQDIPEKLDEIIKVLRKIERNMRMARQEKSDPRLKA